MKTLKFYLSIVTAAVVLAACTTTEVKENPPGSGQLQTNHIVDPKLTAGLEATKAINDASKPFNPFAGVVEIGLGTVAALAAWFAKRKNDQLNAVVAGVEESGDAAVKKSIQKAAKAAKVETALNKVVKSVTE